ncbi:MAG: Uma2 family endonuclease [Pleurocapsa sp.]
MVKTPSKSITFKEFLALPETKPAREYVDGQIIQKPIPKGKHSTIQGELVIAINSVLKPPKIARAFPELGWLIDPDEQSVIVYFPQQKPAFFAEETDILPVPEFAKELQLTLGKLFGWLKQ